MLYIMTHTHRNQDSETTKAKFPYVDKWLSNTQINQKLSNHFWKNEILTDAQITLILKFRYAQYMGNHMKNIFWPLTHHNPNCKLCHLNDRDTWTHLFINMQKLILKRPKNHMTQ